MNAPRPVLRTWVRWAANANLAILTMIAFAIADVFLLIVRCIRSDKPLLRSVHGDVVDRSGQPAIFFCITSATASLGLRRLTKGRKR